MSNWVRITGIVLLLYIHWSLKEIFDHPDNALGLIVIIPLVYLPILFVGGRLIFASPVDRYRRIAACFSILFLVLAVLNNVAKYRHDFTMQVSTTLLSMMVGPVALIVSLLPKPKVKNESLLSKPEELVL